MKPMINHRKFLLEDLKDPAEAAGYLNAVLETGHRDAFLSALRDVAAAQGGLSKLARQTKLHRQTIHRMLSKNGNPEIVSLEKVLEAMGLRFFVGVNPSAKLPRAA
ncbi:MAG: transcriptional regulator [Elusimicrobiota bacterium]|jgi:probable addiction module antidote protein